LLAALTNSSYLYHSKELNVHLKCFVLIHLRNVVFNPFPLMHLCNTPGRGWQGASCATMIQLTVVLQIFSAM
jgi:hypothetical protein